MRTAQAWCTASSPATTLAREALALAESLAGLEPAAVSAAKRAVRHGMDAPLGQWAGDGGAAGGAGDGGDGLSTKGAKGHEEVGEGEGTLG